MAEPALRRGPLPARLGTLLGSPVRALAEIDAAEGGGVRDVFWLVIIGTACLRLQDVGRALAGVRDGNVVAALRQTLGIFAQELQVPVVLSIIAGVVVTLAAGRGRRDPAIDIELGAAAYAPAFIGHILVAIPTRLGATIPALAEDLVVSLAGVWAITLVALAVRTARRRPLDKGAARATLVPVPAPLRDRIAVTALAAVLGGALLANTAVVARRGPSAPLFSLPRVDGQGTVALASLRGQVVLLDFWATWCAPCLEMLPTMDQLYGEYHPRGVEFVGINSDGPGATSQDVREFLRRRPIPYPVVMDEGDVGGQYNVTGLPHFVVLDRAGSVSRVFFGLTTHAELARALDRVLRAMSN
jgi:cytochrome c biogenesis protein CcmG/thiol:disulfide interchange protein DsbE